MDLSVSHLVCNHFLVLKKFTVVGAVFEDINQNNALIVTLFLPYFKCLCFDRRHCERLFTQIRLEKRKAKRNAQPL